MTGAARHGLRRLLIGALALPFVLVSLIGTGVMPARDAQGALVITLCSAAGVVDLAIDPATMAPFAGADTSGAPHGDSPAPDQGVCDWAAAQAPFLHAVQPVLAAATPRMVRAAHPFTDTIRVLSRATGLPPATGPPRPL